MTLDPGLFGLMLEKMVGMLGEIQKGLNVKGVTKRNGGEKPSVDLSPMNEEWTRVRGKRPKVVKRKPEPAQALNSFSGLKEVRCDGKAATNLPNVQEKRWDCRLRDDDWSVPVISTSGVFNTSITCGVSLGTASDAEAMIKLRPGTNLSVICKKNPGGGKKIQFPAVVNDGVLTHRTVWIVSTGKPATLFRGDALTAGDNRVVLFHHHALHSNDKVPSPSELCKKASDYYTAVTNLPIEPHLLCPANKKETDPHVKSVNMRVPADAVDALRGASGSGGYFLSVPNFADSAPCRTSIQLTVDFKLASSLAGELRLPLRFYRHSRKLGIVCLKTDEDYVRSKLGENALPPPPEGLKFCLRSRSIDAMSSLEVVQVCAHQGWEISVVVRYRSRKELPKMIVVAKEKPKSNFIILRDDMITIKEVGLGKQNPDKMDLDEFPHLCQPNAAPSVGIDLSPPPVSQQNQQYLQTPQSNKQQLPLPPSQYNCQQSDISKLVSQVTELTAAVKSLRQDLAEERDANRCLRKEIESLNNDKGSGSQRLTVSSRQRANSAIPTKSEMADRFDRNEKRDYSRN